MTSGSMSSPLRSLPPVPCETFHRPLGETPNSFQEDDSDDDKLEYWKSDWHEMEETLAHAEIRFICCQFSLQQKEQNHGKLNSALCQRHDRQFVGPDTWWYAWLKRVLGSCTIKGHELSLTLSLRSFGLSKPLRILEREFAFPILLFFSSFHWTLTPVVVFLSFSLLYFVFFP